MQATRILRGLVVLVATVAAVTCLQTAVLVPAALSDLGVAFGRFAWLSLMPVLVPAAVTAAALWLMQHHITVSNLAELAAWASAAGAVYLTCFLAVGTSRAEREWIHAAWRARFGRRSAVHTGDLST